MKDDNPVQPARACRESSTSELLLVCISFNFAFQGCANNKYLPMPHCPIAPLPTDFRMVRIINRRYNMISLTFACLVIFTGGQHHWRASDHLREESWVSGSHSMVFLVNSETALKQGQGGCRLAARRTLGPVVPCPCSRAATTKFLLPSGSSPGQRCISRSPPKFRNLGKFQHTSV